MGRMKEVYVMFFDEGLSTEEIAETLNIPEWAIRELIFGKGEEE
jgi:DNA-binding transcriptional regulator LsrR (DeoR family)